MAAKTKITRKQAEQALAAIKDQFKIYLAVDGEEYGPKLIENWEPYWNDSTIDFVIMWEEGPYEWAYNAKDGGVDEELSSMADQRMDTPAATTWPEGVWCEPATSYCVALYLS